MSERDTPSLLQDILEAIGNIKAFTQGLTFDSYQSDLKTKHAVERNFAIIGEVVARIDAFRVCCLVDPDIGLAVPEERQPLEKWANFSMSNRMG